MLDGDAKMLYAAQQGALGGRVFEIEERDGSGTANARSSRQNKHSQLERDLC